MDHDHKIHRLAVSIQARAGRKFGVDTWIRSEPTAGFTVSMITYPNAVRIGTKRTTFGDSRSPILWADITRQTVTDSTKPSPHHRVVREPTLLRNFKGPYARGFQ